MLIYRIEKKLPTFIKWSLRLQKSAMYTFAKKVTPSTTVLKQDGRN